MKFHFEQIVDKSLTDFKQKLYNFGHKRLWQSELKSIEHISGTPGITGCKTKLIYTDKRFLNSEIIETIGLNDQPNQYNVFYASEDLYISVTHTFKNHNQTMTFWRCDFEVLALNNKAALVLFFRPKAIKTNSWSYMINFKNHLESKTPTNA